MLLLSHDGLRAVAHQLLAGEGDLVVDVRRKFERSPRACEDRAIVWVLDERGAGERRRAEPESDVRAATPSVVLVADPTASMSRIIDAHDRDAIVALDDAVAELPTAIRAAARRRGFLSRSVRQGLAVRRRSQRRLGSSPRT